MSIHDEKSNGQPGSNQPGGNDPQGGPQNGPQPGGYGYGPQQGGYGQRPGEQQNTVGGMGAVNQVLRRAASYGGAEKRSAEALRALNDVKEEGIKSQDLTGDFELTRFDRDANRVGLPSVLVHRAVRIDGDVFVVVRTLLLDCEGIRLPPQTIPMANGQRQEVETLPQDVYTENYWNRIVAAVQDTFGSENVRVVDAGPLLVTKDFDFHDTSDTMRLLVNSINRCGDVYGRLVGEEPFSIGHVMSPNDRLTARIDTSGEHRITDIMGHPIRNDLMVTMASAVNDAGQDEFFQVENEFNYVSAIVSLELDANAAATHHQPGFGGNWGQQQAPQPMFVPTITLTDIGQASWIDAETLELMHLAMSNAFRCTAQNQWARYFLPSVGTKGPDPRDIGALGYLTPQAKMIDTKSDKFGDQQFAEWMQFLVKPQPAFLIDVNPMGEHSGNEGYLIDAAFEGPNQAAAHKRLVEAADNLFDGWFSQFFDVNKPIVVPYEQEVHLGYYTNADGDVSDIRDLDFLAMLNYTQGNMNDFMEWYRSLCDTSIPREQRLRTREMFERQYLSKNLTITGRAIRLLLTPDYIQALDAAGKKSGLQVSMDATTEVMGATRFAGNTLAGQYSVERNAEIGYGAGAPKTHRTYGGGVGGSGRLY